MARDMRGIVFEGGGAKGAYQIGAAKALYEMGYEFDAVAGTSVGALNGAAVAQDDILRAYDVWSSIEPDRVFSMDEYKGARNDRSAYIRLIKRIIRDRGLDTGPLNRIIYDFIDEDRIRKRNIIFGLVTVLVKELKHLEIYLEDIPKGRLCEYIIASANFPLFKAARIDGRRFSDGGFYNNYPINMLIDKGVRDIVSVRTLSFGIVRNYDLKDASVIYIEPREKLGSMLDFSNEKINRNMKLGYYDAYKQVKGYMGNRYYIRNDLPEDFYCGRLNAVKSDNMRELSKDMGMEETDPKRFLFEILIPKAAEYLGLDRNTDYNGILLALYEMLAEDIGLERFRIYKYSDFVRIVEKKFRSAEDRDVFRHIPGFLTRKDLLPKIIKNRVLKEVAVRIIK